MSTVEGSNDNLNGWIPAFKLGGAALAFIGFGALGAHVYGSTIGGEWSRSLGEGRKISYTSRFFVRPASLEVTQSGLTPREGTTKLSQATVVGERLLLVKAVGPDAYQAMLDYIGRVCVITANGETTQKDGITQGQVGIDNSTCIATQA